MNNNVFEIKDYVFLNLNPDDKFDYWIDIIQKEPTKKYVLWDVTDNNHLHPYDFTMKDDYQALSIDGANFKFKPTTFEHKDTSNEEFLMNFCYLYVILKTLSADILKNIIIVTTDINFEINLENVQLKMWQNGEISEDVAHLKIKYFLWYWTFLHTISNESFYIKPEFENIDKKYNVCFPVFGRKLCRLHMLSEIHTHEQLSWSNVGHPSTDGQMNINKEINNLSFFQGNYYTFNRGIIQSPDFPLHTYWFIKNKFHSHEKKVLTENRNYFLGDNKIDLNPFEWQYRVPIEFIESSVYLFFESFIHLATHPTEKTWKAFLHKKPFLCVAGPNYYRFLKKLGFKLYDEIFDYSFDGKLYQERFKSVLEQVKKILDMNTEKLQDLLNQKDILEKLEYNKKLSIQLSNKLWKDRDIKKFNIDLFDNEGIHL